MSQPVYWVGRVGPHRCPLHELVGVRVWRGCPRPRSFRMQKPKLSSRRSHYRHPMDKLILQRATSQEQVQEAEIQPISCSPRILS